MSGRKSEGKNLLRISDARKSLDYIKPYNEIGPKIPSFRSTFGSIERLNTDLSDYITLDKKFSKSKQQSSTNYKSSSDSINSNEKYMSQVKSSSSIKIREIKREIEKYDSNLNNSLN